MAKHKLHGIGTMVLMRWPIGLLTGVLAGLGAHVGNAGQTTLLPAAGHAIDLPAWSLLAGCWLGALCCAPGYRRRKQRRALRQALDELAALPQPAFEERVLEAVHRLGYRVDDELHDDGALAGLLLYRNGSHTLLHCRHWRQRQVNAQTMHELAERMDHGYAAAAKILAIGDYTDEAWKLAAGHPIDLIHGEELLVMLRDAGMPQAPNVHSIVRPAPPRRLRHQPLRLVR